MRVLLQIGTTFYSETQRHMFFGEPTLGVKSNAQANSAQMSDKNSENEKNSIQPTRL